ncbi:DUF4234 domain-containing protein [Herbinix luporum]|jgi:hypothetical protein|uniref:Putative membrane protein n=1 Tax=Herbinix luporum TaxID=1679721 RepID=A0A0K8J5F9_9FIRM|nr:DUF4234 domain-containing protein [Herbinix luporum]MDI9488146.1 DUF4234 domain-containing protein [Bacillota bacterium]CUH92911.1 putative membrane protein [Herbinix luporum]
MVRKKDIVVCIILTIITCGLYNLYWLICLAEDINTLSNEADTSGGMVLLLTIITCGIYGLYWAYRCGEKIDKAKQSRGINTSSNSGILFLLLYLLSRIICFAIIQHEINKMAS